MEFAWQTELINAVFWLFKAFFWVILCLGASALLLSRLAFGQKFWQITKPCLDKQNTPKALLLLGCLVFFVLLEVKISVLNTVFYNQLYSSLQDMNAGVFWFFAGLNASLVVFKVLQEIVDVFLGEVFQISWLKRMNAVMVSGYLADKNYYRLHHGQRPDNIDQRIEQDSREFITTTVTLLRGVINAVMSTVEFTIILWGLSGILVLFGFDIPKGVVFFIYIFIIVATLISVWIGKPLILLNFDKEKLHGDYRYSLIRVQEHAESIAFYDGEPQEKRHLKQRFNDIIINRWAIVRRTLGLDGFNTGVTQVAMLLPLMLQAPRFFAGQIKLGDMHQTVQSFNRLMRALSFFRLFYEEFTLYQARLNRLHGFLYRLHKLDQETSINKPVVKGDSLTLNEFQIFKASDTPLIPPLSLALSRGDRLLIQGTSGTGKTTLLKAMAGICPFKTKGEIVCPVGELMFVPQRSYMPQGTLRQAICYPDRKVSDDELIALMRLCHLHKWVGELDTVADYQLVMSPGELQRVAFVRVFLQNPTLLCLDEATSALDEALEQTLYQTLLERLPECIIISIGHRSTLHKYHNRQILLVKAGDFD